MHTELIDTMGTLKIRLELEEDDAAIFSAEITSPPSPTKGQGRVPQAHLEACHPEVDWVMELIKDVYFAVAVEYMENFHPDMVATNDAKARRAMQ